MYAIEFQTTIKNGAIEVPQEYRNNLYDQVRVILLSEEVKNAKPNLIDKLLEKPIEINKFQPLTREEIYEQKLI